MTGLPIVGKDFFFFSLYVSYYALFKGPSSETVLISIQYRFVKD